MPYITKWGRSCQAVYAVLGCAALSCISYSAFRWANLSPNPSEACNIHLGRHERVPYIDITYAKI